MENRYQKFLRETLKPGVEVLLVNPEVTEINGIPLSTFEILIRAFYGGLSEELKIALLHDLANPEYLRAVLAKIDILLSPGIPETVTLSNSSNIRELILAYDEAQKLKDSVIANQQSWQAKSAKQFEEYNRRLILGLQKQLEKDLPSLPPEKRDVLARDLARTIGDQAFPGIELSWQTKDKLRETTELTLKTYASEVEELRKPEFVSQIAQRVAQEQETATWETRSAQIQATTFPATYRVDSSLRAAIIANLPPEIYQRNPKVVEEISRQVLSRLSLPALAQQPTFEDYQRELTSEIRTILTSSSIRRFLPAEQQAGISSAISSQIGQVAQNYSISPKATMAGVAAPAPPPPPGGPPPPFTGPRDELGDIFFSSGSPGHILTSLASPQAGENLAKWAITGGLLRAPLGFALESVPGTPKLNYILDLFGPYFEGIKGGFIKELAEAQKLPLGYERERLEQEATTHLAIISQFEKEIEKKPWLKLAYQGRVGLYRILHPIRYLQLRLMQRSLALGIGVQSLSDIISAYVKYGGYGGAYITEAVLKNLAVFALKVMGVKIGLYEVVGVYPYQKYIFKPTHRLKLKFQQFIYEKAFKGLAEKLGQSALGKILSGILTKLAGPLGWILNKLKKWIGLALGAFLIWLITQLGTIAGVLTFLGGMALGGFIGSLLGFGPWGTVIGIIVGPFVFGGLAVLVKNLLFPEGAVVGAGGFGGGIGAIPSLTPYAAIVPPTFIGLGGLTALIITVYSTSFFIPGQPSPIQSEYIEVGKEVTPPGNLGEPINYTLTITASKSRLTNIKISDTTTFVCQGQPPSVPVRNFAGQIPSEILPGPPLTLTYQVQTNQQFNDCLVTNTVQVTADVPDEEKTGEESFITATLTIGNPPVVAPQGVPLKGNVCLSGYDFGEPGIDGKPHLGIDISSNQLTVYSTFPKESKVINVCNTSVNPDCRSTPGGYSITLGLGQYQIYFAHLDKPPAFEKDDIIPAFGAVGIMGNTGIKVIGVHVHYMVFENNKAVNPHSFGANPPRCQ